MLCDHNDILSLTANSLGSANEFVWSTNINFSDTINSGLTDSIIEVSPNQDTWYYITVNNTGCSVIDSVFIDVPIGSLNLNGDSLLCWGDSLLLKAEIDQNHDSIYFEFSPDSISLSNNINDSVWFRLFTNQFIKVFAIDSVTGCQLNDSIFIIIDTLPNTSISVTADYPVVAPGNSTLIHVEPNGYQYEWEPFSSLNNQYFQHPTASPISTTTYTVNVKSESCTKSDSITIEVNELTCGEPDVFIPNAFSPNDDNNNDEFKVRGNYISEKNFEFKVFDRLGNLVFSTTSPLVGWIGNFSNTEKACDPGVFVYYIKLECLDGQSYFKKGNVTLLK